MTPCQLKPTDKRTFIGNVGEKLVKRFGKHKYYRPEEIRKAATECGYPDDWLCWALCIFTSPEDFKVIHEITGEACDYATMKADVLTALAGESFQLPSVNLSWLEWPEIDLAGIFDWFHWDSTP